MNSYQIAPNNIRRAAMLLLALFPILQYYALPVSLPFSIGEVLLLLFSVYVLFRFNTNQVWHFPKHYVTYWAYCAIIIFITNGFKVSYLLPGGLGMCLFSLWFAAFAFVFDEDQLLKFFRYMFIPLAAFFVIQEISFRATGTRITWHLPIASETAYYGGLTFDQLEAGQSISERSCSLFMETSYFAEFLLMHLCLEFFGNQGRDKLYNYYSIAIILVLLFARSGSGMLGLAFLGIVKMISYQRQSNNRRSWLILLVTIPVLLFAATKYVQSEIGSSVMDRHKEITNQSGSAYDRIFRGFEIYEAMPTINKIIGIDVDVLRQSDSYNGVETLKEGMLLNGFQYALVTKGFIGLAILLAFFVAIFKNSNILTKSALGLLLVLSLFESVYFSHHMLILTLIALNAKRTQDISD